MKIKILGICLFLVITSFHAAITFAKSTSHARVGELQWIDRGMFEVENPFKKKYKNWHFIELVGAAPFYGKITSPDGKWQEDVLLMHGKNKSSSEKYGQLIGKKTSTSIYAKE